MGLSRIFWDTNIFVYLFEDYAGLSLDVANLRRRMIERGDQLFTSTMTLGEILVKPIEKGDEKLRRSYWDSLTQSTTMLPFDLNAASHYAQIRRDRGIKPPDAIQLACAAQAGIDLFVTNDERLRNKVVPGIQFIVPLKGVYL
jgi:predicted nucleic acid-binding protein